MRKDTFIAASLEAGLLLLAALLSFFLRSPLIFASLGPTIYEMVEMPSQPSARPYNVLVGHSIGLIAGVVALEATHAFAAPALSVHGIPLVRVLSVVIASFLTVVGTLLLKATQPAALSTTLLVALGTMETWQAILSVSCGVLLIVFVGEPIRRWRLKKS
jgi:hypothetical protein